MVDGLVIVAPDNSLRSRDGDTSILSSLEIMNNDALRHVRNEKSTLRVEDQVSRPAQRGRDRVGIPFLVDAGRRMVPFDSTSSRNRLENEGRNDKQYRKHREIRR